MDQQSELPPSSEVADWVDAQIVFEQTKKEIDSYFHEKGITPALQSAIERNEEIYGNHVHNLLPDDAPTVPGRQHAHAFAEILEHESQRNNNQPLSLEQIQNEYEYFRQDRRIAGSAKDFILHNAFAAAKRLLCQATLRCEEQPDSSDRQNTLKTRYQVYSSLLKLEPPPDEPSPSGIKE